MCEHRSAELNTCFGEDLLIQMLSSSHLGIRINKFNFTKNMGNSYGLQW